MYKFTVPVQTSIGRRIFLFRKIFSLNGTIYQVTAFGRVSNNYFSIEFREGAWNFRNPELIVDWIKEVEQEIIKAIEEHHTE
ncbi:MAG TPA: hypothetical protein VHK91_14800 [Flavisolibacter sp.]|jgi:hypothetical protein|nr:hypothetical protein [Flavisolibacter sp.]